MSAPVGSFPSGSFPPGRMTLGGLMSGSEYGVSPSPAATAGLSTFTGDDVSPMAAPSRCSSTWSTSEATEFVEGLGGRRRSSRVDSFDMLQEALLVGESQHAQEINHSIEDDDDESDSVVSKSLEVSKSWKQGFSLLPALSEQDQQPLLPRTATPTLTPEPPDRKDDASVDMESNDVLKPLLAVKPKEHGNENLTTTLLTAAIYGLINAIIAAPAMVSFAAVVFQDARFNPFMDQLVKQCFLASGIHQFVFVIRSSMPFAVGQVQDVGLIFLSSMASSIMAAGNELHLEEKKIVGVALTCLAISTALVGALVITTGQLRLAGLVQYVPLPVIGGYLAYVGLFCIAAGAFLSTNVPHVSRMSYLELFAVDDGFNSALVKLLAGALSAAACYVVLLRFKHPAALPTVLIVIPLAFYCVLMSLGHNLQYARKKGWITNDHAAEGSPAFWELWKLFDLGDLPTTWTVMIKQIPTMLVLCLMVAFGSSMDIAAVQQEFEGELDYNRELVTIGVSNLFAGMSGAGFTGSCIFSQSLFSLRSGVKSRLHGIVVAFLELMLFIAPFSPIRYLPSFFFGALTMWIGFDIVLDWIIKSFFKVTRMEYLLLWVTFISVTALGLMKGLVLGVFVSLIHFAYSYAKVNITAFSVLPSRGCALRPLALRSILELFAGNVIAVSLSGYIFFGSSVKINDSVRELVQNMLDSHKDRAANTRTMLAVKQALPGLDTLKACSVNNAINAAPRFLLLDFRHVNGLDATAARSFSTLFRRLGKMGVELLITHLPPTRPGIRRLLVAHGVISGSMEDDNVDGMSVHNPTAMTVRAFTHMENGLNYCEEQFLRKAVEYQLISEPMQRMRLCEVLRSYLTLPKGYMPSNADFERAAAELEEFLTVKTLTTGERLFSIGDPADELCIVEKGKVTEEIDFLSRPQPGQPIAMLADGVTAPTKYRVLEIGAGGIVGQTDFHLRRPRSCRADCIEDCRLLCLKHSAVERMAIKAPHLLNLIQAMLLRSTSMTLSHAMQALERAGLEP